MRSTRLFRLASPSIRERNRLLQQSIDYGQRMEQIAHAEQQILAALVYAYGDENGELRIPADKQIGLTASQKVQMTVNNEDQSLTVAIESDATTTEAPVPVVAPADEAVPGRPPLQEA